MSDLTVNAVLAGLVFIAMVVRLAQLQRCDSRCVRDRMSWHLWMLSHVAVAAGAMGVLVTAVAGSRSGHWALPVVLAGIALGQAVRIRRYRHKENAR